MRTYCEHWTGLERPSAWVRMAPDGLPCRVLRSWGDGVGKGDGVGGKWGEGREKPFMTVFLFFTNGLQMRDGELIGPSKSES